jgi:hypothetical protein
LHRFRLTTKARLALITLLAGGLLAVPASASAGKLETGVLDPGQISHTEFKVTPSVAMQKTAEAGADYARIYLYWRKLPKSNPIPLDQQSDPAKYDWTTDGLDANVQAALDNHLKVMLTVRSAPDWAQRGGHDSRGTWNPDPAMFKRFLRAAILHFGDKVKFWGIWNEPNSPQFLNPQYKNGNLVSPGIYANLLRAADSVIYSDQNKIDHPDYRIVAGETSPFGHTPPRGHNPGPLAFLRKLLCMSGGGSPQPTSCNPKLKADIWTTHPYTSGSPWHHAFNADDVSFGDVPAWKKLVSKAVSAGHLRNRTGGKGVGYWLDEFSWDTKPPDPDGVPLDLHARWTAEALYRTWTFGIGALFWGQLRDYPLKKEPYQSGLYFCDATPKVDDPCSTMVDPGPTTDKPALQAFRFPFVAYASNGHIRLWGRTPTSDPGSVDIKRKTSSGWKHFATATADPNGIFSRTVSSSRTKGFLKAFYAGQESVKFSLVRPKERFVNPFGCGGGIPC